MITNDHNCFTAYVLCVQWWKGNQARGRGVGDLAGLMTLLANTVIIQTPSILDGRAELSEAETPRTFPLLLPLLVQLGVGDYGWPLSLLNMWPPSWRKETLEGIPSNLEKNVQRFVLRIVQLPCLAPTYLALVLWIPTAIRREYCRGDRTATMAGPAQWRMTNGKRTWKNHLFSSPDIPHNFCNGINIIPPVGVPVPLLSLLRCSI